MPFTFKLTFQLQFTCKLTETINSRKTTNISHFKISVIKNFMMGGKFLFDMYHENLLHNFLIRLCKYLEFSMFYNTIELFFVLNFWWIFGWLQGAFKITRLWGGPKSTVWEIRWFAKFIKILAFCSRCNC
jgi:hypothetical protein